MTRAFSFRKFETRPTRTPRQTSLIWQKNGPFFWMFSTQGLMLWMGVISLKWIYPWPSEVVVDHLSVGELRITSLTNT